MGRHGAPPLIAVDIALQLTESVVRTQQPVAAIEFDHGPSAAELADRYWTGADAIGDAHVDRCHRPRPHRLCRAVAVSVSGDDQPSSATRTPFQQAKWYL